MSVYASPRAHASAKEFFEALPGAVDAGITASAQTAAELALAADLTEGDVARARVASSLNMSQALQIASVLDDAGFTAFRNAVHDAVDAAAPEGWTPPV